MEKKKIYCLILNGCLDVTTHPVALEPFSVMRDVLRKEYTNLETIEEDFMELDNKITIGNTCWLVEGSFPVFAYEIAGKLYDCVTCKETKYSSKNIEVRGLSYEKLIPVAPRMADYMLRKLEQDEEAINRYVERITSLEEFLMSVYDGYYPKYKYYRLNPNNYNYGVMPPINARIVNGTMIDLITKTPLYKIKENEITHDLSYRSSEKITEENAWYNVDWLRRTPDTDDIIAYQDGINEAKKNNIRRYNNYKTSNKDKNFDERVELDNHYKKRTRKI